MGFRIWGLGNMVQGRENATNMGFMHLWLGAGGEGSRSGVWVAEVGRLGIQVMSLPRVTGPPQVFEPVTASERRRLKPFKGLDLSNLKDIYNLSTPVHKPWVTGSVTHLNARARIWP